MNLSLFKKPIVVRARCVTTHSISITLIDWKGHRKLVPINNVSDVMEYSNPVKGGALLKACLVYSKVVDENVDNDCSLSDYLQKVRCWVKLVLSISEAVYLLCVISRNCS